MVVEFDVDQNRIGFRVTFYNQLAPFVFIWDADGFNVPRLNQGQAVNRLGKLARRAHRGGVSGVDAAEANCEIGSM